MINEERGYMTKVNNMIPEGARYIIHEFARYGHQAYLVGGCVRDIILNRTPHDWDICTDATPEKMELIVHCIIKREEDIERYCEGIGKVYVKKRIKTIPTGLKHGTLTIVVDDEPYEVTTFRCDGKYSDGRRPDSVSFTNSLLDDLQRRDFTINAIAYSMFQGFIDPYHGMKDIESKVIRCVGNPYERFNEDGLRIMRAVRFSAQLGFKIDHYTRQAMNELVDNLDNVSNERINSEMYKIMSSCFSYLLVLHKNILCKIIPEFKECIDYNQNNPYHTYTLHKHTAIALIEEYYSDPIINLAILFHDIGKPHCCTIGDDGYSHFKGHGSVSSDMTKEIMKRLKFDNDTINKVTELVFYHDATFTVEKKSIKRWLNKLGEEQFRRLLRIRIADIKAQNSEFEKERIQKITDIQMLLDVVLQENECFTLKDLAINGKDLIQHGIPEGKTIGIILNTLLTMVIDGEINNDKDSLFQMTELLLKGGGD